MLKINHTVCKKATAWRKKEVKRTITKKGKKLKKFNKISLLVLGMFLMQGCFLTQKEVTEATPAAAVQADVAVEAQGEKFEVKVIPNIGNAAEAYFSPDGKSLIGNAKNEGDTWHMVYTINVDGTNRKRINDKGMDACSFYHPDGKSLIWTSTRDNLDMPLGDYSKPDNYPQGAELYTSDLDGNNVKRLTNNEYYDAEVAYSPDASLILFGRQIDGKMDLWIMNGDGTDEHQITFTDEWQEGGSFIMPDNKTIIGRCWKRENQGKRGLPMVLYTMDLDGKNRKWLTPDDGKTTNWAPYPAPDGIHYVYVKVVAPHNYEVFLGNLETDVHTRLTYNDAFDGFPTISPDGNWLVFSSSRGAAPTTKKGHGSKALTWYTMDLSSFGIGAK